MQYHANFDASDMYFDKQSVFSDAQAKIGENPEQKYNCKRTVKKISQAQPNPSKDRAMRKGGNPLF
jgi:hypothetical protein